ERPRRSLLERLPDGGPTDREWARRAPRARAPAHPPQNGIRPVRLAATDLMSLEQYARERAAFRGRVLEHKRARQLQVGPDTTWSFEDRLTIQYQVQEMLRVERIFEPEGIAAELGAYNPLIPDGNNWKVTLLIEFAQPEDR